MTKPKPFGITQAMVLDAYKRVKSKNGAGGMDEVSMDIFEKDKKNNLYRIWNRMASGTYFPPPVLAVTIPKKSGGERVLGIPTIADRIAQMVVKQSLEEKIDTMFCEDSYGYRPNKSALEAIAVTRKRCWKYDWVLEFDIVGLFDNIDHKLLMKAVEKHAEEKWQTLYIMRWLKAPIQTKSRENIERASGVPQGGVISPLLANLFMHYVFDKWMKKKFTDNEWSRYADDAIVHCRTYKEAIFIKDKLNERLESCGLQLHKEKTHIVYCKDSNRKLEYPDIRFTFLGYEFRPRQAKGRDVVFTSFLPAISTEAKTDIRQKIREWHLLWMTNKELKDIAEIYNPIIRGWINYYGKYGKSELSKVISHVDKHLCQWYSRKYKTYRHKKKLVREIMEKIAKKEPWMFAHWEANMTRMVG